MMEYHDAVVRVRYAETDQMGVVYHANYLIWFEPHRGGGCALPVSSFSDVR